MSENLYRVIFISDLIEAHQRDVVKRNLATLFGTTAGNMERLFSPSPIVLKKNLAREEAIRFRDAIIRCGAFCRIETMDSIPEVVLTLADDFADESMVCPRCLIEQVRSALCRSCGAIVEEYVSPETDAVGEDEINRRYFDRRQDLEASVNVTQDQERRNGRDRRRAHLDWRM